MKLFLDLRRFIGATHRIKEMTRSNACRDLGFDEQARQPKK